MTILVEDRILGVDAFHQLVAELAAADELITELIAENEDLRSQLSREVEISDRVPPHSTRLPGASPNR